MNEFKTDQTLRASASPREPSLPLDDITGAIVDASMKIHMGLGPGLLVNFGGATLKDGLHRIVNNLQPSASPHLRVNHPPGDADA